MTAPFLRISRRIETPEADGDADAKLVTQSVYAVDCEMVRAPSCVPGYRMLTRTNIGASPRTARRWLDLHNRLCDEQGRI